MLGLFAFFYGGRPPLQLDRVRSLLRVRRDSRRRREAAVHHHGHGRVRPDAPARGELHEGMDPPVRAPVAGGAPRRLCLRDRHVVWKVEFPDQSGLITQHFPSSSSPSASSRSCGGTVGRAAKLHSHNVLPAISRLSGGPSGS